MAVGAGVPPKAKLDGCVAGAAPVDPNPKAGCAVAGAAGVPPKEKLDGCVVAAVPVDPKANPEG